MKSHSKQLPYWYLKTDQIERRTQKSLAASLKDSFNKMKLQRPFVSTLRRSHQNYRRVRSMDIHNHTHRGVLPIHIIVVTRQPICPPPHPTPTHPARAKQPSQRKWMTGISFRFSQVKDHLEVNVQGLIKTIVEVFLQNVN